MAIWTKSAAACQQLDGAIGLLAEENIIAAHSLVAAGAELATAVAAANGKRTHAATFEDVVARNAPHRLAEVRSVFRRPQNFAKHADRDPGDMIEVEPNFTIFILAQALVDLGIAFDRQSFRQAIFRAWFAARFPDLMIGDDRAEYLAGARKVFGDMEKQNLSDALRALRETIRDLDTEEFRAKFDQRMSGVSIDWDSTLQAWDRRL